MEVEKGISEYGTYIHTNILNKIVKVHRQRIQKLTGMFSQMTRFLQKVNTREDDRFLLDFYLSSAHSQLLTL